MVVKLWIIFVSLFRIIKIDGINVGFVVKIVIWVMDYYLIDRKIKSN